MAVLYEDAHLLVLNKPSDLLSVPGKGPEKQDCLSVRVQQRYPEALVVHRLDMGTSGLMMMARSRECQRILNHRFASRDIFKRYEAVISGTPQPGHTAPDGWSEIDDPIRLDWAQRPKRVLDATAGKPSRTRWRLKRSMGTLSLLELEPLTGRSHQLRVHLSGIGHPIVGDRLYGDVRGRLSARRLMLHACELSFEHPYQHHTVHLVCPSGFDQISF